jgi:cation:H+ antiporter
VHERLLPLLLGHGPLVPLVAFLLCGVAVFLIASRLTRHADEVADATGLGRIWIGTMLLAASTSLPELTTDVNAAAFGTPNIGVGDLFGSTMANMLLLALLDLGYARRRILDHVSRGHVLTAALSIALMCVAAATISAGGWNGAGWIGFETPIILGLYLLGTRAVYDYSRPTTPPEQLSIGENSRTLLRRGLMGFALSTVGLLLTAPLLVISAQGLAVESALSETFVGTLLVGVTTSFPEVAATIAAVRLGALDLAVGNIFGSNAFNMCVLFAMDLADRGPLLAHVSHQHVLTAQFAIMAVSFGILGILIRRGGRIGTLRIWSLLIVLTYAGAAWLLATGRGG